MDIYNVKVKNMYNQCQIIVYSKSCVKGMPSTKKGQKVVKIDYSKLKINDIIFKSIHSFKCSSRRTKNSVYDIARSNKWDWFITLTFDPIKVDSFDYSIVTKKLKNWLDRIRRICDSDFKYIIVPELHKSGRIHFHGLFSNCNNLVFVDSGKRDFSDNVIYNIGKYNLGWSTATKVIDNTKVTKYIAKYISKELSATTKGKRRYWCSKNCDRPKVETYEIDKGLHNTDLHNDFLSDINFIYAQEKETMDHQGNIGYIRYYEFQT